MFVLIHTDYVGFDHIDRTIIGIFSSEKKIKEAIKRNMGSHRGRIKRDYSFQEIVVDKDIED